MSDVHDTTKPVEATEPTTALPQMEAAPEEVPKSDALATEEHQPEVNGVTEEAKDAAAVPAEAKTADEAAPAAAEKTIEPVTEGQLGYKGPGLLK